MIGWHLLISIVLAAIGWFITEAIGIADPWPIVVGVIVFLAYWGFSVIIIDDDLFG